MVPALEGVDCETADQWMQRQVRVGVLPLGPDPAQQCLEGDDPSGVEREHAQQFVLGGGELDLLPA